MTGHRFLLVICFTICLAYVTVCFVPCHSEILSLPNTPVFGTHIFGVMPLVRVFHRCLYHMKTRVHRLSHSVDLVMINSVILTQYQCTSDSQTDEMDGQTKWNSSNITMLSVMVMRDKYQVRPSTHEITHVTCCIAKATKQIQKNDICEFNLHSARV